MTTLQSQGIAVEPKPTPPAEAAIKAAVAEAALEAAVAKAALEAAVAKAALEAVVAKAALEAAEAKAALEAVAEDGKEDPPPPNPPPNNVVALVGLLCLIFYGAVLYMMFTRTSEAEPVYWQRAMTLFTGVESLALAAAGFFFGQTVNKQRAVVAEVRADQQTRRAERQAKRAALQTERAQAEGFRAEAIQARGKEINADVQELFASASLPMPPAVPEGADAGFAPNASVTLSPADVRYLRRLAERSQRYFGQS